MQNQETEFLRPIVSGWLGKIDQAIRHKKPFTDTARQCEAFFSGAVGFMWESEFQDKYFGQRLSPTFRMTMAKAFELVAIFGPVLYWRNPQRVVKPTKILELPPDMFGDPNDPNTQQIVQQIMAQEGQRASHNKVRTQLLEMYLNYTPREQPGGGLARHAQKAITEALIKGRGCLWTKPYRMPGSQRQLTGSFYDTVDNLLIDPDAESLHEAKWIAQRCVHPTWEVEREYNLKIGSLEGKGSHESAEAQGELEGNDFKHIRRQEGKTHDLLTYYKIWSKGGVGSRLTGVSTPLKGAMESVLGDHCYIVVAPDIPFPLNAPTEKVRRGQDGQGMFDSELRKMFEWPVPTWTDDRWPVSVLDFYEKPRSPWPIAPIAPGLGELCFLNVLTSHLANRIWSSSRDLIAVLKSAAPEVEEAIRNGEDLAVIKVSEANKELKQVVQFIDQPNVNIDAWQIIDRVSDIFDKRTGLTEMVYGMSSTQSRSASDARAKQAQINIRPDYMSSQVEAWMTHVADLEKFCARWFIEGKDVEPLVGGIGSQLWTQLITNEDPEIVMREMRATVEAGSARKPNRERDQGNLNEMSAQLLPMLAQYAQLSTDSRPLNAFFKLWGEAIEQETGGFTMGAWGPPPPPPEVQQQQQVMSQAQMALMQADAQLKQAQAAKAMADAQGAQIEAQTNAQQKQLELQFEQVKTQQEIQLEQAKFQVKSQQEAMKADQELRQDQEQHEQEMAQADQMFRAKIQQSRQEALLGMLTAQKQSDAKVEAIKAQGKAQQAAKPKPTSNGSNGKRKP